MLQKKTLHAIEQNREDVKIKRQTWVTAQPEMDTEKPVFPDESSINTGMTGLYGRAQSNERVVYRVPDVRFERTTILSSVRTNGDMVPPVFKESLNGSLFATVQP